MAPSITTSGSVTLVVAADRMRAWVQRAPGTAPSAEAILAVLAEHDIPLDSAVEARCAAVAQRWAADPEAPPTAPEGELVAEGVPPVEAQDGRFEWAEALRPKSVAEQDGAAVDYFALCAVVTVPAGTVIGRVAPPEPGRPGRDIYGQPQPPKREHGTALKIGPGVQVDPEGDGTAVATSVGRVDVRDGCVRLYDELEVPGDVDFSSGSINACIDVHVRGSVRTHFRVHTTARLTVDKAIEAADVRVGGDCVVRGGVFGKGGVGRLECGGHVTAHLLNETMVVAAGDVRFTKEVLNSRVVCQGRLDGQRGTVIGGDIYAREGVRVHVLGSEAQVRTAIAVGTHVDVYRHVRRLERRIQDARRAAEQIRTALAPLLANLKRLTPAQRERATELMSRADEIEFETEGLQAEIERRLAEGRPKGTPQIEVGDQVHAGVQLTLNNRVVDLKRPLLGPLRIELRKIRDATEVVAVNLRTGSVTILPSCEADLDTPPSDLKEAAKPHESRNEQPQAPGRA